MRERRKNHMEYQMEELVPIVAKLSQKYTKFESTSITYEKAEQFMEAVLYTIHEIEIGDQLLDQTNKLSAIEAYEYGKKLINEKIQNAIKLYHEILTDFDSYGNRCLSDTFEKGMPAFFKWYDVIFKPQDNLMSMDVLDYPVYANLSQYKGVDTIWEFLKCIKIEQNFLHKMTRVSVIECLSNDNKLYRGAIENICYVVYSQIIKCSLIDKPLGKFDFSEEDEIEWRSQIQSLSKEELEKQITVFTKQLVDNYYEGNEELLAYLLQMKDELVIRWKVE